MEGIAQRATSLRNHSFTHLSPQRPLSWIVILKTSTRRDSGFFEATSRFGTLKMGSTPWLVGDEQEQLLSVQCTVLYIVLPTRGCDCRSTNKPEESGSNIHLLSVQCLEPAPRKQQSFSPKRTIRIRSRSLIASALVVMSDAVDRKFFFGARAHKLGHVRSQPNRLAMIMTNFRSLKVRLNS